MQPEAAEAGLALTASAETSYLNNGMKQRLWFFLLLLTFVLPSLAQSVGQLLRGRVVDAKTGEAAPFVNVFYEGGKNGRQTDAEGCFSIPYRQGGKLMVSSVGYETFSLRLKAADSLLVRLRPTDLGLGEATVKGRKTKYSRKNNPAVILMEKVIAAKRASNLRAHDFYSVEKYDKLSFALSDITPKVFEEGELKRFAFLKDHVETSSYTGKLILPLSVDETVSQQIYRKEQDELKTIVRGQRTTGMNELIDTGDILNSMLQDVFTEVNLYEDDIRFVQSQFLSPIAGKSAIGFYRYFIEDTVMVAGAKCIEVSFGPNNPRDFGFSGSLFIHADSTFRIARADIGIPIKSTVNYVKRINIVQEFDRLPSGEQVLTKNDMFVVLEAAKFLKTLEVRRYTEYTDYDFSALPAKLFRFNGNTKVDPDARMQNEQFWAAHRTAPLSTTESRASAFVHRILNLPGLKPVIWVGKSLIENYVPTSLDEQNPSKIDIGPVNTIVTTNPVDGVRVRASLQTTAHLSPNVFWAGYLAYGFRDKRWKGMGEMTYSFRRKHYLPMEFPVSNLTFRYSYDVASPSDQYVTTDKDNIFMSFKWAEVKHMMYNRSFKLFHDQEWTNGMQWKTQLRHETTEPTYHLFYQPLAMGQHYDTNGSFAPRPYGPGDKKNLAALNRHFLTTTDLMVMMQYQPGVAYINTKQRRILVNKEAPIFRIAHTVGLKGVWSDYSYNLTELGIRKRIWLRSWGRMDFDMAAGAQWNRVPFPLLCMPKSNLSYVYEDKMFYLVNNMEFLNDRYAQLLFNWNLHGKIFNRLPLIRQLKWREHIGVNVLWGGLTDKNNPFLERNKDRTDLFFFPGEFVAPGIWRSASRVMDPHTPYVEAAFGVHNIFKILHVDYVRRFTYLSDPATQRWGIRFVFRVIF